MSRFLLIASFGISFFSLFAPAASAQMFMFVPDRPTAYVMVADRDESRERFELQGWRGVQPRKERPHFNLGAVDYRLSSQGIKARFQHGDISATAQIGHAGTRVEFDSPALARNSKLAFIRDDGGFRVEIALSF